MEKKYDILTALDICVDFLIQLGDVEPTFGQKEQLVKGYELELGGSSCIFACQAAKLGLKTAGIGVAGTDRFGGYFVDKLQQAGVSTEHIRLDSSVKTGVGAALCKNDGDRAILTYTGTIDGVTPEAFTSDLLKTTRHIHIGSYFLMKKLQPGYPEILSKAKKTGAVISIDTNWDPDETWDSGLWDILPYIDILFANEREVKAMVRTGMVNGNVEALSKKVPVLVIKLGENGALAYSGGKEYRQKALTVQAVDTVGAGDSFDAGFVYGYLNGWDLEKCLQVGCICGSYTTTMPGGIAGQIDTRRLAAILGEDENITF